MHRISSNASSFPSDCQCETDPISCIEEMFVQIAQMGRINRGQCPARRAVFVQTHGVIHGIFQIRPDLPETLKVGIFGQKSEYPIWMRFSTDPFGQPDFKSTVGVAVKLFGVEGEKVLSPDERAITSDFIFQNINVFFVDDAHDMCAFTKASLTSEEAGDQWLKDHPRTQEILNEMEKIVPTALGSEYWSVIPFHFGDGHFCKYKLEPEAVPRRPDPNYDDPDYLQADLTQRMAADEYRFKFLVQLQTDPESMPLDKATVPWNETVSPPIHVATLILPRQDLAARGQNAYGEELSFNPWRTLAEHKPVGTIADARRVAYRASATLRRNVNGQPLGEPVEPRPETVWPAAKDTFIVRAAIHPGIGVARIGDSKAEDGYYIGPEVVVPPLTEPGQNRDGAGAIKRQAARFRVYGYNAAGEVVKELDADSANVEWTVHLANKKAQWYEFQAALDIPDEPNQTVTLRNPDVDGDDRGALAIDPGPRTISGVGKSGKPYEFDSGTFQGTSVPLGELRTDDAGRLLVLGGVGYSHSPTGQPVFLDSDPSSFNNAAGWFDDISDGPVTAKVSIDGRDVPVDPSWVVVAPPNFAPDIVAWRTLYDLLVDVYVAAGRMELPATCSFTKDVLPVLQRLSNLQWVNKGFATMFGKGCPMDFENPSFVEKLAYLPAPGESDPYKELRQEIYNCFRPADNDVNEPRSWPWIYGDAFGSFDSLPENNLALSQIRALQLKRWVEGEFESDWDPSFKPPTSLDDVPLADQPATLDQAALHFCLADAFHPGCEMTWPMRHATMYAEPFRILHRAPDVPEPDYGDSLSSEVALSPNGPLYAQGPGDISRWMALPWQGDTAFCRSGYDADYDPYLPTFWSARVPNQVLAKEDYEAVMDASLPRPQRIAAYNRRVQWLRSLKGSVATQMMEMIARFGEMGIVEAHPGVTDDPDIPSVIFVEGLPEKAVARNAMAVEAPETKPEDRRIAEAGWESREQMRQARRIRGFRR